jgi:hypothetical protein
MSNLGLSVADVVTVQVSLTPNAAALRSFGSLLILGDSDVIDVNQRFRSYVSLDDVGGDFGGSSPEFQAAQDFFGQTPQPQQLFIGRWARTATHGTLAGAILGASQQAIANFTTVVSGGMTVTVDGTPHALTGINLSAVTNLNGVAAAVQAAFAGVATVQWDANNDLFFVKSASTGPSSTVSFATAPGSGTDISGLLGLTATAGGYTVAGINAETALAAATDLASITNAWYGLMYGSSVAPSDSDYLAVGGFIQALTPSHIFGVTTQEAGVLSASSTTDIAFLLKAAKLNRTFVQYSSSDPYACAAMFGIAFTVDFEGSNTTITLKFKQEGEVTAETITETQAAALKAKNCNVFVNYNNATAILQEGVMSDGTFFDVIHGADFLQNDVQTALFNLFLTTGKVPQTDGGVNKEVTVVSGALDQSVTNGFVAPGVWNGGTVGALQSGQTLAKGYYVFAPAIATQSQADRAARKSPTLQAAIKLAGAFHSADVLMNFNS